MFRARAFVRRFGLNNPAVMSDASCGKTLTTTIARVSFVAMALAGCAVSEINSGIDSVNKSIKSIGSGSSAGGGSKGVGPTASTPPTGTGTGSVVSFRRRVPADADINRMPVEDGAMQLRIGFDFSPTATIDNALPYHWSASCDLFYLVLQRLPQWAPPSDGASKFSFEKACVLNEGGQAFRRSANDDPIRKRRPYQFNNSFDVADAIKEWQPVYAKRRTEIEEFKGDRFFFMGARGLNVQAYNPADQSFRITVDVRTGYAWNKPIAFVGTQLVNQSYSVKLKTSEPLARTIERARLSPGSIRPSHTKVVFKVNGAKEYPDRIDLDITLEKIQMQLDSREEKTALLVDLVS